jgi:acyl transferase domain-containing protein
VRSAAINSFADGGTNVHAILESWPETGASAARRKPLQPPALQRIDISPLGAITSDQAKVQHFHAAVKGQAMSPAESLWGR